MPDARWWTDLFASVDAKDTRRFLEFLADGAAFRYGSGPAVTGKAAIGDAVDAFFASITSSAHQIGRCWDGSGSAACEGTVRYVRRDSREVEVPFCNVLTLADGRITDYRIYIDPAPLLAP
jgi:ketosteroid isomerase-like protein